MNQKTVPQVTAPTHYFTVLLAANRRGARRAREHTERQLAAWGVCFEAAAQIVAELASNAVLHGRVPGRDFRLRLKVHADRGILRVEVTDARGDRIPQIHDPVGDEAESGRGLRIIDAYADRWGVEEAPAGGKTVWAELAPDRGTRDPVTVSDLDDGDTRAAQGGQILGV
ncbi:ATP-binding protein [Streptomyces sp. 7R015]|uniref:ATP-binding protein n=1 Tax=Streptomyces cylindrosporus TaxID=2927583 RepID=A0ABS9Y584_9ACTN|nr:ATP-binding protein [Streptomyces cylindrosporus]MCI3272375.1 ATP-binding protein [Streptomyces cylindrosporus]